MAKILLLTGDAGESQEILYPKFRLEEEEHLVHVVAPTKKAIQSVVHDFEPGFDTFTEKPGYRIEADFAIESIDPSDYDALVVPGGRAPEFLRNRPPFLASVRHFLDANKPIAAICHGPLLLIAACNCSGRVMAAYPDIEPDLRACGVEFRNREVVVDGTLVTARGWPDNGPWMREFVKLLAGR